MDNKIKSFSDFKNSQEPSLNEAWYDGIFGSLGTGFSDVIKGKVSAYLLSFFGINEQSIFSKLVQNFVEQIPLADLTKIIFAGKVNSSYLAPKLADATIEFLTEKGLDGIAEDLKIEPDGWIYRTISEMLSNRARTENFRETLVSLYMQAFNGFPPISTSDFTSSLSPSERSKVSSGIERVVKSKDIDVDTGGSDSGDLVNNFLSGLLGNSQSMQSMGLGTGRTIQ